jgi:hypothetical protein
MRCGKAYYEELTRAGCIELGWAPLEIQSSDIEEVNFFSCVVAQLVDWLMWGIYALRIQFWPRDRISVGVQTQCSRGNLCSVVGLSFRGGANLK